MFSKVSALGFYKDEKGRNVGGADVINIANDAERLDGLVPFGALIGAVLSIHAEDSASESKRKDESHFVFTLPRP